MVLIAFSISLCVSYTGSYGQSLTDFGKDSELKGWHWTRDWGSHVMRV